MSDVPVRYRSDDEDSARWLGFPYRDGDIVISARSKSGTTWMQMICALLVFQTPDLPESLSELSPWLDWLITPRAYVFAQLSAQQHRRVIKTRTPLDGMPLDARATYIVVARHRRSPQTTQPPARQQASGTFPRNGRHLLLRRRLARQGRVNGTSGLCSGRRFDRICGAAQRANCAGRGTRPQLAASSVADLMRHGGRARGNTGGLAGT